MSEFDPYKTPAHPAAAITHTAAIVELAKGWEKLRLAYNGIMILPGIAVLAVWITKLEWPVTLVIFFGVCVGIAANIAFFLGPLAELYIRAYFRDGEGIGGWRKLVFSAGLAVSAIVILIFFTIPLTLM